MKKSVIDLLQLRSLALDRGPEDRDDVTTDFGNLDLRAAQDPEVALGVSEWRSEWGQALCSPPSSISQAAKMDTSRRVRPGPLFRRTYEL